MTFEVWFNENEGFALRSERLYDDLANIAHNTTIRPSKRMAMITAWLQAAYEAGQTDYSQNPQNE